MAIGAEFYDANYFENGPGSGKSSYRGYNWNLGFLIIAIGLRNYFEPQKVLDVGCAKGFLVSCLRKINVEAYGVDISDYALAKAELSCQPFLSKASATNLAAFGDGEFDLVLCYDILEHLDPEEITQALREVCRISHKWVTMKSPFKHYSWDLDTSHIGIKPKVEWQQLFAQEGFRVFEPEIAPAPHTWWDDHTLVFRRETGVP